MKKYTIEMRYTFTGTVEIKAENRQEAIRIAEEDFGCVGPTYDTSNDEQVIDWEFPVHPEAKAVSINK